MNRENAMQEIKRRISCKNYLQKSKGGLYCCPFCNSGNKANHTGALEVFDDSNRFKCHACGEKGDVIDIYRQITSTDYNTALYLLAQEIGETIDAYTPTVTNNAAKGAQISAGNINAPIKEKTPEKGQNNANLEAQADYTEYYAKCAERLPNSAGMEYLKSRGISEATAQAYKIGYDPEADPAGKGFKSRRIIIPVNKSHYIARAIDPNAKIPKMNPAGITPGIFNSEVLHAQDVQEVIVTESATDALSILEAGAPAIATNSTSNIERLIKELEQQPTEATLILSFDNDESGERATAKLRAGLQKLNISYRVTNISGEYKDANEALQKDKDAFFQAVSNAIMDAKCKPDNVSFYIDNIMGDDISQFRHEIKTGFPNIDRLQIDENTIISNGLYSGLYCLAAISSLGKTTFALQLADQIAAAGNDVLFFSLEQSRLELVSKSLARTMAQRDMKTASTSIDIRKGKFDKINLFAASDQYKADVQDRMNIIEGNFNCDVKFISSYVSKFMDRNPGAKPVIFVDYLQILQPEVNPQGKQQGIREAVDTTITTLKRMSREYGLTIFVISSVNRTNYLTPIDFESIKESGGIEYTCDVVWGLQLQCLNSQTFTTTSAKDKIADKREMIKAAKREDPRKIELVCLKNRYGIASYSAYFDYYPAHDLFKPCKELSKDIF